MRIAIFSDTYAPEINGVARTLKRYTDYLEKRGIEYRLFVPNVSTPVPTVPQVQRLSSIPFLLYPDCRLALPNPHIKHTLEQFKPTLIHIATPINIGLYGLHYGKKNGIPMVASYHTNFDDYLEYYHLSLLNKLLWKYMHWFHRSFDKVFVPSKSTKEKLLQNQIHDNIELWGRGVNHQMYTPNKRSSEVVKAKYQIKEKNLILYVGRIAPEKDIHIVLETFYSLPEHIRKDAHLIIVGDGPLFDTLSEQHQEQITWTGFMEGEQLAEVYASSDVFLFPSPTETFGNVVLEALSSGLPVIGANAGGVQHLVKEGKTGFLCEPKKVNQFARQTSILLENSDLRSAFSYSARAYAKTISWDEIFDQLLESFKDVLYKKKRISA
ncbi:glycosyltransferase family 4 protein [Radiobacillus deserti]|uniref:Glycosyltransferase family 1 protein n=1 Tax=Radiobacillus deserti TaxID=2594883 RepID=A0A516KG34_9BACI|nr:glycosyltransferase family 1 protein [Radiobacillus deserti]QDP40365.1 glycosyltransferase family 1 protein [Radiobacillus deserti]